MTVKINKNMGESIATYKNVDSVDTAGFHNVDHTRKLTLWFNLINKDNGEIKHIDVEYDCVTEWIDIVI